MATDDDGREGELRDGAEAALLDQRVVMLSGEVDAARASTLAASLLTLDATGDRHIELRLSSCRGPLAASLAVIDVLDVLGVPVHGTAIGTIEGGPVAILASTERRRVAPHALLSLREPDVQFAGTAGDLERALAAQEAERRQFLDVVAARVGRPFAEVEAEWARASRLEATDAVSLGYADEVLTRTRARPAVEDESPPRR